jgi:hypothetical protein
MAILRRAITVMAERRREERAVGLGRAGASLSPATGGGVPPDELGHHFMNFARAGRRIVILEREMEGLLLSRRGAFLRESGRSAMVSLVVLHGERMVEDAVEHVVMHGQSVVENVVERVGSVWKKRAAPGFGCEPPWIPPSPHTMRGVVWRRRTSASWTRPCLGRRGFPPSRE